MEDVVTGGLVLGEGKEIWLDGRKITRVEKRVLREGELIVYSDVGEDVRNED
jgi:hypothetical protein